MRSQPNLALITQFRCVKKWLFCLISRLVLPVTLNNFIPYFLQKVVHTVVQLEHLEWRVER